MIQEEFIYPGAINNIDKILKKLSVENIFLVHGNQSYLKSGAKKLLNQIFQNYNITEFSEFSVNPKLEEARIGYASLKQSKSQLIIAVGGGSVIDMAKIIKYLAAHDIKLGTNSYSLPLIAIPTTAGTGSEATHFAVAYIDGMKHSYEEDYLLPDVAIVDANLLEGQSKYQMAVSGLDAFAQGIESFWSINSTEESLEYSSKAFILIWENLKNAIKGDQIAKEKIAEGAFWAGKAIRITKTTGPHALSYFLTEKYNIPHGHAVSFFLPSFFLYNNDVSVSNCNDLRGPMFVQEKIQMICNFLKLSSTELLVNELQMLIRSFSIDNSLNSLNITPENVIEILKNVNTDRMKNNPRVYKFNEFINFII